MKLANVVLTAAIGAWLVSLITVGLPSTSLTVPTYPNSMLSMQLNALLITTALATSITAYLGVKSLLSDNPNLEKGSK